MPYILSPGNRVLSCKDGNVGNVQETLLDVNRRQSDFAQTLHAPLCKIRTLAPFSFEDFEQLHIRYALQ